MLRCIRAWVQYSQCLDVLGLDCNTTIDLQHTIYVHKNIQEYLYKFDKDQKKNFIFCDKNFFMSIY